MYINLLSVATKFDYVNTSYIRESWLKYNISYHPSIQYVFSGHTCRNVHWSLTVVTALNASDRPYIVHVWCLRTSVLSYWLFRHCKLLSECKQFSYKLVLKVSKFFWTSVKKDLLCVTENLECLYIRQFLPVCLGSGWFNCCISYPK
jgi:hypothetical protein